MEVGGIGYDFITENYQSIWIVTRMKFVFYWFISKNHSQLPIAWKFSMIYDFRQIDNHIRGPIVNQWKFVGKIAKMDIGTSIAINGLDLGIYFWIHWKSITGLFVHVREFE